MVEMLVVREELGEMVGMMMMMMTVLGEQVEMRVGTIQMWGEQGVLMVVILMKGLWCFHHWDDKGRAKAEDTCLKGE